MAARDNEGRDAPNSGAEDNYPLKKTTSAINERLGLYLSTEQQRGFATGLLIGTAIGAALLVWNLVRLARRGF
jgi:hypothetical protein